MSNILEIKDLSYKMNRKTILQDINLNLVEGKIVALLGENGAGKTTLMRLICGLAKQNKGQIVVAGQTDIAAKKACLSFTDKLTGFSDATKIQKIVDFYEAIYQDFSVEEFNKLRDFMKLNNNMKLGQLSRGMKEKLIIALAFSRQVDLYLLDEPFSGIDSMSRRKIINSIILWKSEKSTILISDHFVNEIASLLDEVVIIKDHQILTHKSAEEIRATGQTIEDYYEKQYEGEE
ncbi:ABC transporter ATP-binding protein [Lactobacillus psittaci]|nr:ABC transporter ATP-binding protein [Lactobacillus psittaci]